MPESSLMPLSSPNITGTPGKQLAAKTSLTPANVYTEQNITQKSKVGINQNIAKDKQNVLKTEEGFQ